MQEEMSAGSAHAEVSPSPLGPSPLGQRPFEAAFAELEEIVRQLEDGELSLEEAIALYERGQALARHCQAQLDRAELRVTQLADDPAC